MAGLVALDDYVANRAVTPLRICVSKVEIQAFRSSLQITSVLSVTRDVKPVRYDR